MICLKSFNWLTQLVCRYIIQRAIIEDDAECNADIFIINFYNERERERNKKLFDIKLTIP